jgi:hypothetical protein
MERGRVTTHAAVTAVVDEACALEHPDRVDELLPRIGYFHGMTET